MRKLSSDAGSLFSGASAGALEDWAIAIAVVVATFFAVKIVRAILSRIQIRQNASGPTNPWALLREEAKSISNLIYIVGFKIAIELAPMDSKLAGWIDSGIYVLAVVLILVLIRHAALSAMEWSASRATESQTLQQGFVPILRNLITLFVFVTGAIMVLKHFNYDVLSLLTALGVGSLAVGLAAKDTLSNMISGFMLIIDRNLRPGDRINLGGVVGDVEEIGLRSTRMRIGDGNMLIVPNAELVNTKILNLSMPTREVSCSTLIRAPYSIPFPRIKAICLTLLDQMEGVNRGRGRSVNLSSIADGNQLISVTFWANDLEQSGALVSDFNERLLARLAEHNISLVNAASPTTAPPMPIA